MPRDRYLSNSTAVLNYSNYLNSSLAYLQLRKPAFLCGDTRSFEHQQLNRSLLSEDADFQKSNLTESTRFRLKRVQKNPFLKSHNIYPKITNYPLLPQPQKIPVSQKQKYIQYHKEFLNKHEQNDTNYLQKNYQTSHENIISKTQSNQIIDAVTSLSLQKGYFERQKPVKDQPKTSNSHFVTEKTQDYNIYSRYRPQQNSRYRPQQTFKQDKQYRSQFNQKEYQYKNYTPSQVQHKNAASDNQTIINRLEENTNQFSQDLYRMISNQRRQQNGQKTTGTFVNKQPNYSSILGVINRINEQGQMRRQRQNEKINFPEQIVIGKMTYYSVKVQ